MHIPYTKRTGRKADFRVKYDFYTKDEGGRMSLPIQGYRCDFYYDHPEHPKILNLVFMIWPEFEDETGEVIPADDQPVSKSGTARMWIINDEQKKYHHGKIVVGVSGCFMEGNKKVAKCEVIEVL